MNRIKFLEKNLGYFLIFYVISTGLCSCSSRDLSFDNKLSDFLNSSKSAELNARQKKMFDELYGWEKARKQGIEYCQLLNKGVSKEEIRSYHIQTGTDLISQGKITPEESADIDILNISIELAAQETYCPEHKSIEQIPIKERLK